MSGSDLVVWRHGRTDWNVAGRFQGQLDSALDDVGRAQAAAAARVLAGLRPSVLVSSDSARALDTAAFLAELAGPAVVPDPRLRELDLGYWSGLTRAEVAERYPDELAAWQAGETDRAGGGETYEQVGVRAVAAVTAALASRAPGDGPAVLVTHNGTARSLVAALLGMGPHGRRAFAPLGNARWTLLSQGRLGWRLDAYNAGPPEPAAADPETRFAHQGSAL